jgi:hypothetical protein
MLKLLGNFAKGIAKKKVKKKGAEMAQNMMGSKKESAIVVREKTTTLAPMSSGGALDTPIQKPTTKGSPLDRIDSALLDIINTLKGRRKLMLDKSRRMRQQVDKEKKGKREGVLENVKNMGKKMVGDVVATASGWWEKLQRFLLMTLLGSLVVAIKENWEAIKVQIDKVVNFVQDLWKFMSPILVPLFDALKWVTVEGFKLIGKMMGMGESKAQIDKGVDEVSQELKDVNSETDGIKKGFEDANKDIKNITSKKVKSSQSEITQEKIDENKSKADDRPLSVTNPNKNTGGKRNRRKKYNVGGYVHEDGEVHEGEYVVKESIVKKVGVTSIENVIKTMMQTSTKQIKQNPLKIISVMEGMAQEFAPMGEKLPDLINQTISESKLGTAPTQIVEKMQKTLSILKEQTDYEDPSATTIIIPVPTPSQPSMSGGGGGDTEIIPVGASSKDTLNRYMSAVIQKALY